MIKDITEQDIAQVAEIHKKFLPSIISFYSLHFIEKFYLHHLYFDEKNRIFIGYFDGRKVLGFVLGTYKLDRLFADFLKKNRYYFVTETLKALLKHPEYFVHLFGKIFQVDQLYGKQGIGKKLLEGFEKEAMKSISYYELEVEKNNPALGFYKKNNFKTVSALNGILEKKFLLGKDLK
jgi:ribosomal protein S18 acetylase RimI-like enzyme